jgi:tRNA (guanine-N7-)-methyltransferase
VGKDGSGAGAEDRVGAVGTACPPRHGPACPGHPIQDPAARGGTDEQGHDDVDADNGRHSSATVAVKPPPDRLYGRARGHKLRPRQEKLLEVTLPRLAVNSADPRGSFAIRPSALWLEVGFGGGEHALAQIAAFPGIGLIACEVFENGICSLLSRLVPEGGEADETLPGNLRIWPDDARLLLAKLPDACLDRLFLLFPDPWPKARHAKRRFVHPAMLPVVARVLRPGGLWRVASDDPTYQDWVRSVMAAQDLFDASPPVETRPMGWPSTRYEAKALMAGRRPLYWTFVRR